MNVTRTATIRELPDGSFCISYHVDEMPAHVIYRFHTLNDALASDSGVPWQEVTDEEREDGEIDGDVLYVATWPA
ncbi:MAG: hypothetical protein FJX76_16590 [Armatimonadetes bacterium]|nr:hypothetical protein [Armatimonadota bacterium]